jgi:hypothetical protein
MKSCTNDATTKAAAVADGMRRFGNYTGMSELYRRGCFRHIEDVAYARVAVEKYGDSIENIAKYLDAAYEGPRAITHHCDRVYPPS